MTISVCYVPDRSTIGFISARSIEDRDRFFANGMRFFTNGTWRPRLDASAEIPTPVGERCLACDAAIMADDCGVSMIYMSEAGDAYRPWHLACFRRALGIDGAPA